MDRQTSTTEGVRVLRQLKGAPLSILLAMFLTNADTVGAGWLRSATAYSPEAVAHGLAALAALGLTEQVRRYDWRLTSRAHQLPLPLTQMGAVTPLIAESGAPQPPTDPATKAHTTPLIAESHSQNPIQRSVEPTQFGALSDDSANSGVDPSVVVVDESDSSINSHTTTPERAQALEALRALRIPQAKAEQILARSPFSPPAIIAQAAAWTAYRDSGSTRLNKGLLPNLAAARLLAGDLCPYDAPTEEDKWPTPPPAEPDPVFDDDALAITDAERLWRQVLEQLRQQVQTPAYDLVASAALAAGDEPGAFTVLCPNRFTHDWLANRMAAAIHAELARAAGQPITISYSFPQK